jgi:protein required for attachment to host cells
MSVTWALVADRSEARIFENRGPGKGLQLVEEIAHPAGQLRDHDQKTDRQGRSFDSTGRGRHALGRHESPAEHTAREFAAGLCEKLRAARVANRFDHLVLAAEPALLGRLRRGLDAPTRKLVTGELAKHLLGAGDRNLAEHLASVMNV